MEEVYVKTAEEALARLQEKEKQAMVQSGGLDPGTPKESH